MFTLNLDSTHIREDEKVLDEIKLLSNERDVEKRREKAHWLSLQIDYDRRMHREDEMIDTLAQALRNESDSKVRRQMLSLLGKFSVPSAVDTFKLVVHDPDPEVRIGILMELPTLVTSCRHRIRYTAKMRGSNENTLQEELVLRNKARDVFGQMLSEPMPKIREEAARWHKRYE